MANIIVTGGSGAIASQLVRKLLTKVWVDNVFVIDNLTSGFRWLLPDNNRVIFIEQDVAEINYLGLSIKRPIIFHLAAFFANQNSIDYPDLDLHTNGVGTLEVLRWAVKNEALRVVYASAGCSIVEHGQDEAIREDMPPSLHLATPYQITKALGEYYCNYFQQYVSTVRCRFFNSYGPGEVPGEYRNVIPNFIWRAMQENFIPITGTGEETRDWIYVDDLCHYLIELAIHPDANGEVYNLGTGRETKVIDLAKAVVKLCNSRSEIILIERRSWDTSTRRQADISKINKLIHCNHTPLLNSLTFDAHEGLEHTVEWFKENREKIAESVKGR